MQVVVLPMSNLEEGKYVTEAMFRHKDNATPQELADLVNSLIKLTLIGPGIQNAQELMETMDGEVSLKLYGKNTVLSDRTMNDFYNKKFGGNDESIQKKH